ncbi:hypothetical protein [Candidatus Thiodictyon syntrophicum]|jgi:hypothetical protein|uniref:PilZ domain-containing protein n=1 Tax=Candidatus Thiodictyon syntrophicum TaxID=1166950 RepID=A0A2K8UAZ4_9GAMM|nr:hypothetical protein [Candidatus Thiodictyon syntrophicum]AUB82753.1 hypothetical protein THSYN_18620 [Candidatus Thiodictyon syntrophicum]
MIPTTSKTLLAVDNRRCAVRRPLRYPVLLADCDAITRNISGSGAYFETNRRMVVDQPISFALVLPAAPADAAAKPDAWREGRVVDGRVVRVDAGESGQVGVCVAF